MLKRFFHALTAAGQTFRDSLRPPAVARRCRPVWDNGTDYNVPTFIRRRASFTLTSTVS